MREIGLIIFFVLGMVVFSSCFKIETYPPEPQIELKYFTYNDTLDVLGNNVLNGELCITFVDGDGDIGYNAPTDTSLVDSVKTVFIKQYKKENGVFVEVNQLVPLNFRIPYFSTEGNNPTLKGDIIIHDLNSYTPFEGDTLKYSVYIKDRSGNKSNTVETPELILTNFLH